MSIDFDKINRDIKDVENSYKDIKHFTSYTFSSLDIDDLKIMFEAVCDFIPQFEYLKETLTEELNLEGDYNE